jgi:hypothetical protein
MASIITHPTRIQKTRDVLIRVGAVDGINRPNVNYRTGTERTELYRIDNGRLAMYEFQGATTSNFQVSDDETTYRLIGDAGWTDGVITNSRVQMSVTSYFLKSLEWAGDPESPTYYTQKGKFDEAQSIVAKFKNNKETEAWIEIWKLIDAIDGGVTVYDVSCFAGVVMNYQEQYPADGLVECSFDVMSRGEAYIGLYDSINPIRTGLPNRLTYAALPVVSPTGAVIRKVTAEVTGASIATPVPLTSTLTGVDRDTVITFKYTDGANVALTNLVAASDAVTKPKARLVKVSDKTFVPCVVTVNATTGTLILEPTAELEVSTTYYAEVETGTMSQKVDASGVSSGTGIAQPLVGLKTGAFMTAAS